LKLIIWQKRLLIKNTFQNGIDIDVNCDGDKHTISANGKGFDMEIKFLHDHCKAELKLSLLLRAFQSKIEGIIKNELEKNL